MACYKNIVHLLVIMNQEIVVINLAAILVACSYGHNQSAIKWGGLVIAIGSVVVTLFGG